MKPAADGTLAGTLLMSSHRNLESDTGHNSTALVPFDAVDMWDWPHVGTPLSFGAPKAKFYGASCTESGLGE